MPQRGADAGEVVRGVLLGLGLLFLVLPRLLQVSGVLDTIWEDLEAFAERAGIETANDGSGAEVKKAADKYPGSYVSQAGPKLDQHYFVLPNWEQRNISDEGAQISAVLHGSIGALRHLPLFLDRWAGPVDVAVLLASEEDFRRLDQLVRLLNDCHPGAGNVSFHLLFPSPLLDLPGGQIRDPETFLRPEEPVVDWLSACPDLFHLARLGEGHAEDDFFFRTLNFTLARSLDSLSEESAILHLPYPANLLRAAAAEAVRTPFMLHLDADVIPSSEAWAGLEEHLLAYGAALEKEAIGLVLPAFEVAETECSRLSSSLPRDRAELLSAVRTRAARPFYAAVNERVHAATDYPRWYRLDSDASFARDEGALLNEAYWADWADPYEPFVVFPTAEAPPFDPKFVGYGINRLSQLCEAHLDGFDFAVVDAAFLLHCGLKSPANAHGSQRRQASLRANQALYKGDWAAENRRRYARSERSC